MRVMVLGGEPVAGLDEAKAEFRHACGQLGNRLSEAGHQLVLCSPFPDSADRAVLEGLRTVPNARASFHFPNSDTIRSIVAEAEAVCPSVIITRFPHSPPESDSVEARAHSWLLAQLAALENSDLLVAISGKFDGTASLLLRFADERRFPVLPFTCFGGAAAAAFDRKRFELLDTLGEESVSLLGRTDGASAVDALVHALFVKSGTRRSRDGSATSRTIFLSYARTRPAEADFIETTLRRRGHNVLRDEHSFGAGHEIPAQIREGIHRADTFIATWNCDYACSPHCFDELDLALDRHERGALEVWIFLTDGTRMVPPRARGLLAIDAQSRDALHRGVLRMLEAGPTERRS